MFRSLRLRMALSHAAVLSVILIVLGGCGYVLLARSVDRAATTELETAARAQAERVLEAGRPILPPDSDVPSSAATRLAVFDPAGLLLGESNEFPTWLRPMPETVVDIGVAGENVRLVTTPVVLEGRPLGVVVAGRSLAAEEHLLERVRLLLIAGGVAGVTASLTAGWWLAGRAMRPVERAYAAQAGFAADASHEFRTPLAFIRTGVEVLGEHDPELGEQVLQEVDYLTALTSRLLLLARAERGAIAFERAPVDVAEVCRSAARRSEAASGSRLTLQGGEAIAMGDRVATEAALDAVLENVAVHGGGEADVRWRVEDGEVAVSVADHGPGLPPDLGDRALDRFARADPSRTRDTGGAGLGLTVAHTLLEAQGGSMELDETPGGGLTARLVLPAA